MIMLCFIGMLDGFFGGQTAEYLDVARLLYLRGQIFWCSHRPHCTCIISKNVHEDFLTLHLALKNFEYLMLADGCYNWMANREHL